MTASLAVVLAVACAVAGAVTWGSPRSAVLIAAATVLGCLAGLITCVREHRAGVRSHAGLLAGTLAALISVPVFVARLAPLPALLLVTAVFAVASVTLQWHFEHRRAPRR